MHWSLTGLARDLCAIWHIAAVWQRNNQGENGKPTDIRRPARTKRTRATPGAAW